MQYAIQIPFVSSGWRSGKARCIDPNKTAVQVGKGKIEPWLLETMGVTEIPDAQALVPNAPLLVFTVILPGWAVAIGVKTTD